MPFKHDLKNDLLENARVQVVHSQHRKSFAQGLTVELHKGLLLLPRSKDELGGILALPHEVMLTITHDT